MSKNVDRHLQGHIKEFGENAKIPRISKKHLKFEKIIFREKSSKFKKFSEKGGGGLGDVRAP